jgi:phage terminase large subunit-like protein
LSPNNRTRYLTESDGAELEALDAWWDVVVQGHQVPPRRAPNGEPWTAWLLLGGRGAGKTRAGAEWVRAMVHSTQPFANRKHMRIALVGETEHDVREVMIEGVSGLRHIHHRSQRPVWLPSRRRLEWPNGAVAQVFSAEDPEQLRGPQFEAAWCDELAKWRHADATFDMLQFGLRLGDRPRQVITTTPRPIPLLRRLLAAPRTAVTRAGTAANAYHLSPVFFSTIVDRYAGTRLGRQELEGEMIEERPDALWSRATIEAARVRAAPALQTIVVAIDPPAAATKDSNACGLVAAGRAEDGLIYVIADRTVQGLSPSGWAQRAVALYHEYKANTLIAEVNQGGDMVAAVIREVDRAVPVKTVHARRGKYLRAEPAAAAYEQGKVKHVGAFAELEDEMCDFGRDGLSSGRSPDRVDALVYAVTDLLPPAHAGPRVRWV